MTHKNATARISAALPNTASAKRRIIGKRYTHKKYISLKWKQIYLRMYRDNPAWKSWWHAESPSPEILSFYLSAAIIDICKNEYFHRQSYIYCSRSQDWRREKKACQVKTLIQNICRIKESEWCSQNWLSLSRSFKFSNRHGLRFPKNLSVVHYPIFVQNLAKHYFADFVC